MRTIKIKKGNHMASNQFTTPSFNLWNNGGISKRVIFTQSCKYNVGASDQRDWNKLFGKSWGFSPLFKPVEAFMMHLNSSRFGWRWNEVRVGIEVTPYYYSNTVRKYAELIGITPPLLQLEREYDLHITPIMSEILPIVSYRVEDEYGDEIFRYDAIQEVPSLKGWIAPVYFGGDKKAPHDIEILMDK